MPWTVTITGERADDKTPDKTKDQAYRILRKAAQDIRDLGQKVTTSPDLGAGNAPNPQGDTGANLGTGNQQAPPQQRRSTTSGEAPASRGDQTP